MTLAHGTDSAYPYNYAQHAPYDCEVVLGYVGRDGYTPHVWSHAEAQAARDAGYEWWPIVVGISQGPTNAIDGKRCAQTMIDRAPGYGVSKDTPVIIDIEPNAYWADPAGAIACRDAFKNAMHAAGYPNAFAYGTIFGVFDWVADWTNDRPNTLPRGVIGIQYGGNQSPPGYDLNVFDRNLVTNDGTDWFSMATVTELENAVRKVLNEGTGGGQTNWAGTSKAILSTVQGNHNLIAALSTQSQKEFSLLAYGDGRDILPENDTHPENLKVIRQQCLDIVAKIDEITLGDDD